MRKVGLGLLIGVLGLGGVALLISAVILLSQPSFTIVDADASVTVTGRFDTNADVLASAEITVSPQDIVQPPLDATPDPAVPIEVVRTQKVTVILPDQAETYWTAQTTLGGFLREIGLQPTPPDRVSADGQAIALSQLNQTPLPDRLGIQPALTITLQTDDGSQTLTTSAATVADFLREQGVVLTEGDQVEPPQATPLSDGLTIAVVRAAPYTITADGQTWEVRSGHSRVVDVLADAGVGLIGLDYSDPPLEAELAPGDSIRVVRVTEAIEESDEPLPYQTLYQADPSAEIDTTTLISAGQPGIKRTRVRVRYEDGVEVSRTVDGEWVAQEPVNQVIGYGTNIVVRTINTPDGPLEYWRVVRMRVTAYTAEHAGRPPDHPAYGITASGMQAGKGVVAVDRSVVPWLSQIYVEGYGVGIAGDTGGGVIGRWIDLGYDDGQIEAWSGYTDVYYLTPVPAPDDINYLLPEALP